MKLEFDVAFQDCSGCAVIGNAGQLLQVLMNLIQNAYDATYTPTGITSSASNHAEGGAEFVLRLPAMAQ